MSSEVCFSVIEFMAHLDSLGQQVAKWTMRVSPRAWFVCQPKNSFECGVQQLSLAFWFSYFTDLVSGNEILKFSFSAKGHGLIR